MQPLPTLLVPFPHVSRLVYAKPGASLGLELSSSSHLNLFWFRILCTASRPVAIMGVTPAQEAAMKKLIEEGNKKQRCCGYCDRSQHVEERTFPACGGCKGTSMLVNVLDEQTKLTSDMF